MIYQCVFNPTITHWDVFIILYMTSVNSTLITYYGMIMYICYINEKDFIYLSKCLNGHLFMQALENICYLLLICYMYISLHNTYNNNYVATWYVVTWYIVTWYVVIWYMNPHYIIEVDIGVWFIL